VDTGSPESRGEDNAEINKNKKNSLGEDSVKRNAKNGRWGQLKLNRPHI
jgi:hypothetical protein